MTRKKKDPFYNKEIGEIRIRGDNDITIWYEDLPLLCITTIDYRYILYTYNPIDYPENNSSIIIGVDDV
jgi:hypothetical protein